MRNPNCKKKSSSQNVKRCKRESRTLKSQWGLSAQNSIKNASSTAGIVDAQKQMRHLGKNHKQFRRPPHLHLIAYMTMYWITTSQTTKEDLKFFFLCKNIAMVSFKIKFLTNRQLPWLEVQQIMQPIFQNMWQFEWSSHTHPSHKLVKPNKGEARSSFHECKVTDRRENNVSIMRK